MAKVTIKDVARIAGVSNATVSRALSESMEVSEDTRTRIRRICEELGYTPNTIARAMVKKKTNIIGLIVASLDNPFMSEIANFTEMKVREKGYNLMVCNTSYDPELEKNAFSLLSGRQVDGILFIAAGTASYNNIKPYINNIPTVFLSENLFGINESCVCVDNYSGTVMATEHLYALGHRDILYFGCRRNSITHQLRADGYLDTCKRLNIKPEIIYSDFRHSSIQAGYQLGRYHFQQSSDHTAILCSSDTLAIGVMQAADEAGIRIPEEISLMGFDDISLSALPRIGLTTVSQPKREMTDIAVDILMDKIQSRETVKKQKLLKPQIVERTSCRMIKPKY